MKKPFITLVVRNANGETVCHTGSSKSKRIFHKIKADKFSNCVFKLRVKYADGSHNAGTYDNKDDLTCMLSAFLELN